MPLRKNDAKLNSGLKVVVIQVVVSVVVFLERKKKTYILS